MLPLQWRQLQRPARRQVSYSFAGILGAASIQRWMEDACEAAQSVYDDWQQDAEGVDEMYAEGGICDDVAASLANALTSAGFEAMTFHYEQDNHTVAIAKMSGKTVEVDIPLSFYERGSWYKYAKVTGYIFRPEHIIITPLGDEAEFDRMLAEAD